MNRRFALVTVCLTAITAFLVGLIVAGSLSPTPAESESARETRVAPIRPVRPPAAALVNFADIAERINPAVVNIDATSRARRRDWPPSSIPGEGPFEFIPRRHDPDVPRRGAGSGFIIDESGHILTNHHVIQGAERIAVKLSDGRSLRARVVGTDPDTDIALIKVDAAEPLPVAPLGDSDTLRVGEWVCAIGNPLAYEHSVTVGVVSYIGRKLFDPSLDNYIQTDAAINFGNSGGPLINSHGEVIGINAAISSRASSIGFAIPVNQATAILPQLKELGRVSRGFIGVTLRDVDPDLQQSLRLPGTGGALVQDVTAGSPGERAGLTTYDLLVAVDGTRVTGSDDLIRRISARKPGTAVVLDVVRDGRPMQVTVKLAERPPRPDAALGDEPPDVPKPSGNTGTPPGLGLTVRDLDREFRSRHHLPRGMRGVVISRVEPMSPAFDADIARGQVVLEVNRTPVGSAEEFARVLSSARTGDILTLYLYVPDRAQRLLRTVRVDGP
ncbi:MAG TPA: trypsin-like peptidase domain-containing protein [Vicinamibacterales bacterium]|nr:trypsin-like peptidase domain-containing protein [Vicinamibacterales bacterium]